MFGVGLSEALILGVILLILLGPNQIPGIMTSLGKLFREIAKARQDFNRNIESDEQLRNIRDSVQEVKESVDLKIGKIKEKVQSDIQSMSDLHETNSSKSEKKNDD